ncbi:MAG: RelA/SpoT domain-containing protein [Candidatus Spechtbacterales bacterium]
MKKTHLDEEQLKKDYNKYKDEYKNFQKEVYTIIKQIEKESDKWGIHYIRQRHNGGSIKKLKSILENNKGRDDKPDKYKGHKKLTDLKDIAGVRVACYCRDDRDNLAYYLEGHLKTKGYLNVKAEEKEEEYRAIHVDLAKTVQVGRKKEKIFCEIQVRTVMADAWAVQDTKFSYKKLGDADSATLKKAIADILDGCENLWEMVKRKSQDQNNKK